MEEAVPIHTDGENAGVKKVVEVSLEEQSIEFYYSIKRFDKNSMTVMA